MIIKFSKIKFARFAKINDFISFGITNGDYGVYLAGGSLRTLIDENETIVDYDMFFRSQEDAHRTRAYFNKVKGMILTFQCPEGKLFSYSHPIIGKIQLICEEFYPTAADVIKKFDLDCCCFAWDGTNLFTTKRAISGVKKKHATINCVEYPVSTFKRLAKYAAKGYNINYAIGDYVQEVRFKQAFPEEWLRHYID